jgi:hypothetical protein
MFALTNSARGIAATVLRLLLILALLLPATGSAPPLAARPLEQDLPSARMAPAKPALFSINNDETISAGKLVSIQSQPPPRVEVVQQANLVYFRLSATSLIKRYNLESKTWLPDIVLPRAPISLAADENHLFISTGNQVYRYNLDGSGERLLRETESSIRSLHLNGPYLYINHSTYPDGKLESIDKESGLYIDSDTRLYYIWADPLLVPKLGKLISIDEGSHPASLLTIELKPDGTFGAATRLSASQSLWTDKQLFLWPDEARVADLSGVVFHTPDLTVSNSLGEFFDDMTFYGDLPLVLRNQTVYAYSNTFAVSGQHSLPQKPLKIVAWDRQLFVFYEVTDNLQVETIPIQEFTNLEPGRPVDPKNLRYIPDAAFISNGEILYLLSRSYLSLFRWSIAERRYLPTIPLAFGPTSLAYSAVTDHFYFGYPPNQITQLSSDPTAVETPFVTLPGKLCGLATAEEFVLACTRSQFDWPSHVTYRPDGTVAAQTTENYDLVSEAYTWSPARQRMYFISTGISPKDLFWEAIDANGFITPTVQSPYHSDEGMIQPVRVAPDGSLVVLGSGYLHEPTTLERVGQLSNPIVDAAWKGSTLYTLRTTRPDAQLQRWNQTQNLAGAKQIPGIAWGLYAVDEGLLSITYLGDGIDPPAPGVPGVPVFAIWNEDFEEIYQPIFADFVASPTRGIAPLTVAFQQRASGGERENYLWNFGDGESSEQQNPLHTFTTPGAYTVTLTVSGPRASDTITKTGYIIANYSSYLPLVSY